MRSASDPVPSPVSSAGSSYASGGSRRQRAASLAIAAAVNLLLILMLLNMAGITPLPKDMSRLTVFGIQNEQPSAAKHEKKKAATAAPKHAAKTSTTPAPHATKPAPRQKTEPFSWSQLGVMQLSKQDYAASDVGKIAPSPSKATGTGETQSASDGAGDSEPAGAGPRGEKLYWADWYRRPTDAELRTYLRDGMASPGSWAEVACRTIERYHVEDCVELADYPPGSRLAGAIRQAAFQFLVRPPRVGGKSMVGTWVRIRIDFTDGGARARR